MKKILSIGLSILSIVLLLSAFSFSATAVENESPTVSIEHFNLVFEDNVYIKYAVKYEGVDDTDINSTNIGMLYFTEPQSSYIYGSEKYSSSVVGYTMIEGEKYYTFEFRHLTATQMTDYIYAVAYIDIDGERYFSAPIKYSVLDYAYSKLGITGEESTSDEYKAMLRSMLQYGADAQLYFVHNTDRLANEVYYSVEVVGGTLEDGFAKGLYNSKETITLTATDERDGFVFSKWTNSKGESISSDNPATISSIAKNEVFTAEYVKLYSVGLEYTSNGDGTCSVSGIGTCTDSDVIIPSVSPDGETVIEISVSAFRSCAHITGISIPPSITKIGYDAFYNCTGLVNVHIVDLASWCNIDFGEIYSNPLLYADYLYLDGSLVKELVIPDGVSIIPRLAFYGQDSITSIKIPSSVTNIDEKAFAYCTNLNDIYIGDGLAQVEMYAFQDCINLSNVYISSLAAWCNIEFDISTSNPLYYANNLYLNNELINNLVIPEGVTSIPMYAFSKQDSITSISIPNSLKSIGNSAFYGCSSLDKVYINSIATWCGIEFFNYDSYPLKYKDSLYLNGNLIEDLVIPDGVTKIPNNAFNDQSSIKTVVIPDSVTSIGEYAFKGCTGLTSVIIPNKVTSINNSAFNHCSNITDITFNADSMLNSIGFLAFAGCEKITSISIPDNVVEIDDYAFSNCLNLSSIVINASSNIKRFGRESFSVCAALKTIFIPHTITEIEENAFIYCDNLTIYCEASAQPEGWDANWNPDNRPVVWGYGIHTHTPADAVVENIIDATCTSQGSYDSVIYCSGCDEELSREQITVEMLSHNYVSGKCTSCDKLKPSEGLTYALSSDGTYYSVTGIGTCKDTSLVIPDTYQGLPVTSIGNSAFYECKGLTSVTIPSSVTSIGNSAFYYCTGLTSITIPDGVTSIGSNAFYGCTGLEEIHFNATAMEDLSSSNYVFYNAGKNGNGIKVVIGKNVTKIPAYLFYPYSYSSYSLKIVSVEFEEGSVCESIGSYAFAYCTGLTSITIPDSVTSIGDGAFSNCTGLEEIYFNATAMDDLGSSNDVFYNAGKNGNGIKVVIGKNVTKIPAYLFYPFSYDSSYSPKIVSVEFEEGSVCESIGKYAFSGCTGLTNVYITDIAAWCEISFGDFSANPLYYANNLYLNGELVTNLVIPDSVTTIPNYAFYKQSSIKTVVIPDSVTSIGGSAFYNCTGLKSVTIGNSVTSIGNSAFSGCTCLTSVTIPDSVTSIGNSAFNSCSALSSVILGDNSELNEIGKNAFNCCYHLVSISIPNNVTSIGNNAFSSCFRLVEVINRSTLDIKAGSSDFGCVAYFSKGVHNEDSKINAVGHYVFYTFDGVNYLVDTNQEYLYEIDLPTYYNGEKYEINDYAFYKLNMIKFDYYDLVIPEGVTKIGEYAFHEFSENIIHITIGKNVTSIGAYAFTYNISCYSTVTFEDKTTWYVSTSTSATSGTTISSSTMSDETLMHTYLRKDSSYGGYGDYYWFKK